MSARRRWELGVAAVVIAAAAVWGMLGQRIDVPTVFGDELIYWDATRSLADGDGLHVRGGDYSFGPVYPLLLAPVRLVAADDLQAYRWARLLDAMLFALAAVPASLLARRSLPPRWAIACGALVVAVPSALYTGFVMTEGPGYAAACLALLAMTLVAERPTAARQLFAIGAVGLAAGIRLQLAALGVALVVALVVRRLVSDGTRMASRRSLMRLWPLATVTALALIVAAVRIAVGNPLAGYGGLWQSYDVADVAVWSWRALAGLGLYLGLIPLAAAPAIAGVLAREGRAGRVSSAALLAVAAATTAVLLLVVGAFSSTAFGVGFLHDRYLFYVTPLWVTGLAVWAHRRSPVRPLELAAGGAVVIALMATLPTFLLGKDGGRLFDAVATASPGELAERLGRPDPSRAMLLLAAVAAVALVVAVPRARRFILLGLVAATFVANGALAWNTRIASARNTTFDTLTARSVAWVDAALPRHAQAAVLAGGVGVEERDALRLTEFFNGSVGPVRALAESLAPTLASDAVRVEADGRVVTPGGAPVLAAYVVTPAGIELEGDLVATGTLRGLELWRVTRPLRIVAGRP